MSPDITFEVNLKNVLTVFRAIPGSSAEAAIRVLKWTRATVPARKIAVRRALSVRAGLLEWVSGGNGRTLKRYSLTAKGADELARLESCESSEIARVFGNRALDAILYEIGKVA